MLRIHQLCFARVDPEEVRVEHVHVGQDGTSADIGAEVGRARVREELPAHRLGKCEMASTPPSWLRQNSATLCAPGNRPAMPMIATPSSRRGFNAAHDSPPERRRGKTVCKASSLPAALFLAHRIGRQLPTPHGPDAGRACGWWQIRIGPSEQFAFAGVFANGMHSDE